MKRVAALAFVMALVLGVAPWAGALSTAGPDASTWVETDSMGAWVFLAPPRDRCINDSWIQSHLTFFRGGTGDTMPEDPFDNAGVFTAVEDDATFHSGDIWWIASGRTRLEPTNPDDPCNPEFGVPVQGSFQGKGALRITESTGDGPSRAGVMCSLTFATHLTAVAAEPPAPPFQWTGNLVAHCDDGAMIHLDVFGPTGPGLEQPFGFDQIATGVIHDK